MMALTTALGFLTMPLMPQKQKESPLQGIPEYILRTLEEVTVTLRAGSDKPRALIQLPGPFAMFFHGEHDTPRNLEKMFPELVEEQVRRAARYLDSQVRREIRQAYEAMSGKNWVSRW